MCDYKQLYEPIVKLDSRNAVNLGQAIGGKVGQTIEDEGRHNQQNPGRGVTKAAEAVALWYLGGAAGSALGGAGGAAADAAGNAASQTTEQLAAQAAQDAAESGGTLSANAAGNLAPNAAGLLSSAPQGLGNTLDATLQDSGYTPSSLLNAFQNASSANGTGLGQNLSNYAQQLKEQAANGGLLNRVGSNLGDQKSSTAMRFGQSLMSPQQQQRSPQAPPPRPAPNTPLPTPYPVQGMNSMNGSQPPPGMSMEEWLRLKQQRGLLGGQ